MLQSLWESVRAEENQQRTKSLHERVGKAAQGIVALAEKAAFTDADLDKAVDMLDKAKRGLAAINKLPDGEDKQMQSERVHNNLNKIRAFVNRLVQRQADAENEELDAFDVDDYFMGHDDDMLGMDDMDMAMCSDCDDMAKQDAMRDMGYEDEEVGVVYVDPSEEFSVIQGRSGRFKAVGKGMYRGKIKPLAFDDIESAIDHGEQAIMVGAENEEYNMGRMDASAVQRKRDALADPHGTGYARQDDDHLSYQGTYFDYDDDEMGSRNDPELSRDYGDEYKDDDMMMKGDRDFHHDVDASFSDELTDEEGGDWMDVMDPETADDDYHENEEAMMNLDKEKRMKRMKRRASRRAALASKRGGMPYRSEDEESCSGGRKRMGEACGSMENEEMSSKDGKKELNKRANKMRKKLGMSVEDEESCSGGRKMKEGIRETGRKRKTFMEHLVGSTETI